MYFINDDRGLCEAKTYLRVRVVYTYFLFVRKLIIKNQLQVVTSNYSYRPE